MRTVGLAGIALVLCVLAAPLRAGVYFATADPTLPRTDATGLILNQAEVKACDEAFYRYVKAKAEKEKRPVPEFKVRLLVQKKVAELEPLRARKELTTLQGIDLGAAYIRQTRYKEARDVLNETLQKMEKDDPARFLLLHNLAAAYALDPEPTRRPLNLLAAVDFQNQALKSWPAEWPTQGPLAWPRVCQLAYRRAEEWQLRYYQYREQQARRPVPGATVDGLAGALLAAPDFRFVGPSGRYEAGRLDWKMQDRLPPDALQLTAQLVLWMPFDEELVWLYAELLNAS